jgi:hypothetical protein
MAVAACFGGPVLNLLMGTGAPVLGASLKHGILPFKLTHGVVALFLETVRAGFDPRNAPRGRASCPQICISSADEPWSTCSSLQFLQLSLPVPCLGLMPTPHECAGGTVRGAAGAGA